MPLTDRTILNAKPGIKARKLSDAQGLYLQINPHGSKLWYLKYRYKGKEKKLSFGAYPFITLADARRLRDQARTVLTAGTDPGEKRKEEKRGGMPVDTYASVALKWLATNRTWTEEHTKRVARYFELYVFPAIGERDIRSLTVPDLIGPIKAVENAGKIDVARRLQQRTAAILRYAVQNGIITCNPASDLKGVVAPAKTKHHPALELEQLSDFLRRIDNYKGRELTRMALQLTLLNFIRSSELRFSRWIEIDFNRALWNIPATREVIEGVRFSSKASTK